MFPSSLDQQTTQGRSHFLQQTDAGSEYGAAISQLPPSELRFHLAWSRIAPVSRWRTPANGGLLAPDQRPASPFPFVVTRNKCARSGLARGHAVCGIMPRTPFPER
ncbi:hypothetical protein Bxe_C1355 [Paraburkholderia xenovorans LB400]|uniref:Uncharacterized protein n=1 Tax=Paraburkholderia xenovorans (strain LB400) TaxID=266265 RepID=Q13FD4_PARXL|nr:hypothetical protein Bxe_C1355 [Paraburkholderia xenovorans LB400]